MGATIRLQREPFDAAAETAALTRGRTDIGAVVAFTGVCRGAEDGAPIAALTLEHYPGMAEAEIARHVEEAQSRWALLGVTVIHRYGRIAPGEPIVLVLGGVLASPGCVCRRRIPDGLPQDPRAVLEAGGSRRRDELGRGESSPTTAPPIAGRRRPQSRRGRVIATSRRSAECIRRNAKACDQTRRAGKRCLLRGGQLRVKFRTTRTWRGIAEPRRA